MLKLFTRTRHNALAATGAVSSSNRKSGLAVLALGAMLAAGGSAMAQAPQPVFDYGFDQFLGSYQTITTSPVTSTNTGSGTGTASQASQNMDNLIFQVTLPFTFVFNGTTFGPSAAVANQVVSINTNGWAALGAYTNQNQVSPLPQGSVNNVLAPLAFELTGGSTPSSSNASIRTEWIQNPGANDDVFVIQWSDFMRFQDNFNPFAPTDESYNFQVRLYEGSNNIDFVYGTFDVEYQTVGHNSPTGRQEHPLVGLRGGSSAQGNVNTRTTETNWLASTAGVRNNSRMVLTTDVKPAIGLTYRWSPPIACASATTLNPGTALASRAYSCGSTSNISQSPTPYLYTPPSANPLTLGTSGTTDGSSTTGVTGVWYQWETSSNMGGPYTASGSPTQLPFIESPTGNLWYRVRVACTSGGTATGPASDPVFVALDNNGSPEGAPYTSFTVPAGAYLDYTSPVLSNRNSDCVQNNYNTGNNDVAGPDETHPDYSGKPSAQNSPDVTFIFTTGACTNTVRISTCNPGTNYDTYLHLVQDNGTSNGIYITSNNDDATGTGGCSTIEYAGLLPNTTYRVVVEGFLLAQGDFELTIDQTPNPAPTVAPTSTTACPGGTIQLSANASPAGSYTYTWTGPGITGAIANQENPVLTNVTLADAGQYTVTVNAPCANPVSGSTTVLVGAGPYTVDSSMPTNGANFQNFTDLSDALNIGGVCAPLTVNVVPGIYTDALRLGSIPGSSATNVITINGNGATIGRCVQSAAQNVHIIELNGTDNIVISGFVLDATCRYGTGIRLMNGTDNITISNNTIDVTVPGPNSTSVHNKGIYVTNAGTVTITGNTILGGRRGIEVANQTGVLTLDDNTFREAYEYGIGMVNAANAVVTDNLVQMRNGYSQSRAFDASMVNNLTLERNYFFNAGRAGVQLQNSAGGSLVNNRVGFFQSSDKAYAMYLYNVSGLNIYHNSLMVDKSTVGNALRVGKASGLDVRNNIFEYATTGSGAPVYGHPASFSQLAQNDYFNAVGGPILFLNQPVADLTALAALGYNTAGSFMVDPGFTLGTAFLTGMRTTALQLANVAEAQLLESVDFEMDTRPQGSGISLGADEFSGAVRMASGKIVAEVYPNPFQSAINIQVQDINAGNVQVNMTDLMGRVISAQNYGIEKGASTITLQVEENLAQGVYLLQVTQGEATSTFRVVKQ